MQGVRKRKKRKKKKDSRFRQGGKKRKAFRGRVSRIQGRKPG